MLLTSSLGRVSQNCRDAARDAVAEPAVRPQEDGGEERRLRDLEERVDRQNVATPKRVADRKAPPAELDGAVRGQAVGAVFRYLRRYDTRDGVVRAQAKGAMLDS